MKSAVAAEISILLIQAGAKVRENVSASTREEQAFLKSALDTVETALVHISNYANSGLFKP